MGGVDGKKFDGTRHAACLDDELDQEIRIGIRERVHLTIRRDQITAFALRYLLAVFGSRTIIGRYLLM